MESQFHTALEPLGSASPEQPETLEEWGFGYVHEVTPAWTHRSAGAWEFWDRSTYLNMICPYWVLVTLLAGLLLPWPLLRYGRRLTSRRLPGHCPTCNYDLRAHAPGTKCPECGAAIPIPAKPKI